MNSGKAPDLSNYLPIYRLFGFGKIFQRRNDTESYLTQIHSVSVFTRSTADILRSVTEFVYQPLYNKGEARHLSLDISCSPFHKVKGYGVSKRIFGLIQS